MVSFRYDAPNENHTFHALHQKTGSKDITEIISDDFDVESVMNNLVNIFMSIKLFNYYVYYISSM